MNKWRDRRVHIPVAGDVEIEAADSGAELELEEREYRAYILERALRLMESDLERSTWKACWETLISGRPVTEVAAELGITINAVYLARSRGAEPTPPRTARPAGLTSHPPQLRRGRDQLGRHRDPVVRT